MLEKAILIERHFCLRRLLLARRACDWCIRNAQRLLAASPRIRSRTANLLDRVVPHDRRRRDSGARISRQNPLNVVGRDGAIIGAQAIERSLLRLSQREETTTRRSGTVHGPKPDQPGLDTSKVFLGDAVVLRDETRVSFRRL